MATIVEFAGVPGAGKSFLAQAVARELGSAGVPIMSVAPSHPLFKVRTALRHRRLIATAALVLTSSPRPAADRLQALRLVLVTLERHDAARGDYTDSILLLDEGVVQRLFLLLVEADGVRRQRLDALIGELPIADVIVHVTSSPSDAVDRLAGRSRGLPRRLATLPKPQVGELLEKADLLLSDAISSLRERTRDCGHLLTLRVASDEATSLAPLILDERARRHP